MGLFRLEKREGGEVRPPEERGPNPGKDLAESRAPLRTDNRNERIVARGEAKKLKRSD